MSCGVCNCNRYYSISQTYIIDWISSQISFKSADKFILSIFVWSCAYVKEGHWNRRSWVSAEAEMAIQYNLAVPVCYGRRSFPIDKMWYQYSVEHSIWLQAIAIVLCHDPLQRVKRHLLYEGERSANSFNDHLDFQIMVNWTKQVYVLVVKNWL